MTCIKCIKKSFSITKKLELLIKSKKGKEGREERKRRKDRKGRKAR